MKIDDRRRMPLIVGVVLILGHMMYRKASKDAYMNEEQKSVMRGIEED